jgi:hypothetical protein
MTNNLRGAEIVESASVDDLKSQIKSLSPQEKAQLLEELLGKDSGMSVFFSNGHVFKSDITIQINASSPEIMQRIVDAIATRIENRL